MLYFAYGSNLNKQQMGWRCPAATPLGSHTLDRWKLLFRGVADIVPAKDGRVRGGLWTITDDCLHALDLYEGYREDGRGLYDRVMVELADGREALTYIMNRDHLGPPSMPYAETILQGFKDFGHEVDYTDPAHRALVLAVGKKE